MRRLELTQPFDLELSLSLGQVFRWRKLPPITADTYDIWWSGVLGQHLVHLRQSGEILEYRVGAAGGEEDIDLSEQLSFYFNDSESISRIYARISSDKQIRKLMLAYPGLRVIQQEPWECLVTYILTKSTPIERTKRMVETISQRWGCPIRLSGELHSTFPRPDVLMKVGADGLRNIQPALRFPDRQSREIVAAADRILQGKLNLDELAVQPYSQVMQALKELDGVGNKVANCIAMMAFGKLEAFPFDTWVRQAIERWYSDFPMPRRPGYTSDCDNDAIIGWTTERFGRYAGYAGQYLFHGIRQHKKEDEATQISVRTVTGFSPNTFGQRGPSNAFDYSNRERPCPKCGVAIGEVCQYPSGYRYEQGHKERGTSSSGLRRANRQIPCPRCGAGVGEVCRYPSRHRYEQGHTDREL